MSTMSNSSAVHTSCVQQWTAHNDLHRLNTELSVHQILQAEFPSHHITRTSATTCDLLGYAAAGHAVAIPEHMLGADVARVYRAPYYRARKTADGERVKEGVGADAGKNGKRKGSEGKLVSDVQFGRWRYEWEGKTFLVYMAKYQVQYCKTTVLYVLFDTATAAGEDEKGGKAATAAAVTNATHPATDSLLRAAGIWTKDLHNEIYVFDNAHWSKDGELYTAVQGASWDDVIMDTATKASLQRDVLGFFDNEDLYRGLGVPWKRGLIFHGVPGNGKTITVKALIRSLGERDESVPALYVKSLDSNQGHKWSIQMIFDHARKMAPCLLIFEDLDSLVGPKTRSYFLNEVDGLDDNNGILMIGSTNHLARLDPAITKRPSRFDRKYHFQVPAEGDRLAYCEFWKRKIRALPGDYDFPGEVSPVVAKLTEGFSFAYLKELFMSAMLLVATGTHEENEHQETPVDQEDGGSEASSGVVVDEKEAEGEKGENAGEEKDATNNGEAKKTYCANCEKGTKEKEKKEKKPPRTLPDVEIPESVKDNTLFKIIHSQAKSLVMDMDNTDEEEAKAKAMGGLAVPPFMMAAPYGWSGGDDEDDGCDSDGC